MLKTAALPLVDFEPGRFSRWPMVTQTVTEADWNDYVTSREAASVYHLWGWRRVFEHACGHRTAYLVARSSEGISGALPLVLFEHRLFGRFIVSLPFVTYGGVVASSATAAHALEEAAWRLATTCGLHHVELRHRSRLFPELPARQHKVTMLLPLADSEDRAWQQMDRKVRNHVRKAEKSALEPAVGGRELVEDFYSVYAMNMRDLGTPVCSRAWFDEVMREFPDRARIFVVRDKAKTVAAALSLQWKGTFEVPWASSLREYRPMSPNTLLYWHMMKTAIADGDRLFDFGRSTPNEGTFQFKKQWGAEPEPLWWEYHLRQGTRLPDRTPKNPKVRGAVEAWKHLPLAITSSIGPAIARYLP